LRCRCATAWWKGRAEQEGTEITENFFLTLFPLFAPVEFGRPALIAAHSVAGGGDVNRVRRLLSVEQFYYR